MEFYDDTPATRYFMSDEFVLNETDDRYKEIALSMNFDFLQLKVDLTVYDSGASAYMFEFKGSTAEDVNQFLDIVEAHYNKKVPAKFRKLPSEFLALAPQAFSVNTDLEENPDWSTRRCETCGDMNNDAIGAFYFPAVNEKVSASLGVHWEYGCFGGTKFADKFTDLDSSEEAFDLLVRAAKAAEPTPRVVINEFIGKISAL